MLIIIKYYILKRCVTLTFRSVLVLIYQELCFKLILTYQRWILSHNCYRNKLDMTCGRPTHVFWWSWHKGEMLFKQLHGKVKIHMSCNFVFIFNRYIHGNTPIYSFLFQQIIFAICFVFTVVWLNTRTVTRLSRNIKKNNRFNVAKSCVEDNKPESRN